MADPTLAVLLRNGSHSTATIRYALKCNDVAISYAKTPIQIPIAQQSPELIDLGYFRPSITCTGIIDTVGENSLNTTAGVAGMASFTYTRANVSNSSHFSDGGNDNTAATYYIPYKNVLEEAVASWLYISSVNSLELEIGDAVILTLMQLLIDFRLRINMLLVVRFIKWQFNKQASKVFFEGSNRR